MDANRTVITQIAALHLLPLCLASIPILLGAHRIELFLLTALLLCSLTAPATLARASGDYLQLPIIGALLLLMIGVASILPADDRVQALLLPVAWYSSKILSSVNQSLRERLTAEIRREAAPRVTVVLQIEIFAIMIISFGFVFSSGQYSIGEAIGSCLVLGMISILMFWIFPWYELSRITESPYAMISILGMENPDQRLQICSMTTFALAMSMLFLSVYFYEVIAYSYASLFGAMAVLEIISLMRLWPSGRGQSTIPRSG